MLKFRVDRRVSQHDPSGPAGPAVSPIQLEEPTTIHSYLQHCEVDMNGKVNTTAEKITHSKSATMVSDMSPEAQPYTRPSHTVRGISRTAATFGKRSNSMRRNPKAEVTKQGWLCKQASSGVKQWNKRWFVLTDRCLFYYKDEKEDTVLGSLPLLSFRIGEVESSDNITRKFAFKVRLDKEEGEDRELKGPVVFCMQAEHAGTRTYYFSADSHEEQEEWIRAMSEAADVQIQPTQRINPDTTGDLNHTMVTKAPNTQKQQHLHTQIHNETDNDLPPLTKINGVNNLKKPPPSILCSDHEGKNSDGRQGEGGGEGEDGGGGPGCDHASYPSHHPNGWGNYGPRNSMPHNINSKPPPSESHSGPRAPQGYPEGGVSPSHDRRDQQENVVLRRGFVPRTAPERVAQRKSSMAQLQQWVNQRRGMASQEDINSPSHYYLVNRGVSGDYYGYLGGPQIMEEYPLYPPGVRPDSICSVSAVGGYDRHWTVEEKRHSLRDGPHHLHGPPMARDQWGPLHYGGIETSMRHLSIQPRSRSVPRSPSSSSGGPYSPVPPNFVSPARSPSARFDRFPGRMRDDVIYADPSVYSLRRSLSSPKYDYPGDRRSLSQGLYHYNYPVSPSIHNKMVPPFHDVYSRELHPTLKLNEIEASKLLGRLCEQNRILKDHEAVVHRLRMDKDSLEEALVGTHQEMELFHNQPLSMEKLRFKKETLQNQLINIRGELSQASSALTTTRMEFEALEDEANAIHGDLWEQLNAGGQSELVRRHIQKEFWRVQDVLEGLHKSNLSRGTDTTKHRVASGASGSFSTNSPASPLSSVSLTSPLSPFSPVPGSQASPTKQLCPEVSTGHTQQGTNPNPKPGTGPCFSSSTNPEVRKKSSPKPRPKSCIVLNFKTDPKPRYRPRSYREPDTSLHAENINYYGCETHEPIFPQFSLAFQNPGEFLGRLDPVIEETDQNINCRTISNIDQPINPAKARAGEQINFLQVKCQDSKYINQHANTVQTHSDSQEVTFFTSNVCSQEVKIGLRKDVYPDSHPYHSSAGYPGGIRNLSFNRRFSMPESQIPFLQDSHLTDVLSLCYSPDFYTSSVHRFRGASHGTQLHHQLASQSSPHAVTGARPLTYPNHQEGLSSAQVSCATTQPEPPSDSGKVFMQTHL